MKQERKRNIKKCVVNKHATCKCISLLRCKRKFKMCDDITHNIIMEHKFIIFGNSSCVNL